MKTYLDCIPCFFRQALKASRLATGDEGLQERIIQEIAKLVGQIDLTKSPPHTANKIYQLIGKLTGCADPYFNVKKDSNRLAMGFYPEMKRLVEKSHEPLETAIRLAITGNVIDFGAGVDLDKGIIQRSIKDSLQHDIPKPLIKKLRSSISKAEKILYIGDNAGEIVFDKILIEQILPKKIIYVVRSKPIINDITLTDAIDTGVSDLAEVIENGSDAPGTIIESCSSEFIRHYNSADLIIAKGQGNYETLDREGKGIFFLLKVKCQIVARDTNCKIGSLVITKK